MSEHKNKKKETIKAVSLIMKIKSSHMVQATITKLKDMCVCVYILVQVLYIYTHTHLLYICMYKYILVTWTISS